jgi:hypothetical protein
MKLSTIFLFALLLSSAISVGQPRYSPQVRAERETTWMRDSLHLPENKLVKVMNISLTYNRAMDSVNDHAGRNKDKIQQKLMHKKDADFKALLNKEQYKRYYKREELIRKQEKIVYPRDRQPY